MNAGVAGALSALQKALAHAMGPHVGVVAGGVDGEPSRLHSLERPAIASAIDRRQREFAAGRECARRAMRAIGWPEAPVPSAADRSPQWPPGLTGSISHTRDACVAAVAPSAHVFALGLDIELLAPIDPTLWPMICTEIEQADLLACPERERGQRVARLFSAKEAVFKWQYPVYGKMLEFHDVQVRLLDDTSFSTQILVNLNAHATSAASPTGRMLCSSDHIVSWVITPAAPCAPCVD